MANAQPNDLIDEFKLVYKEKGKNDLKAQVPFLSRLANKYRKLGEKDPTEHWTDLLKAHTLYNSCAVRSDVKDKGRWMQASYDIQKLYWGQEVRVTKEQVETSTANIKDQLETLRSEMRDLIKPLTEEIETWQYSFAVLESSPDAPEIPFQLCEKIKDFSTHCNDSMIDIVQSVIGEAVRFCGEPPCIFSAVAFGSLAKGEATPYSDLEYLFLIEEKSPHNMKYFQKLAVTSYFMVGNVQETNLKYMSIDELRQDKWFVDAAMSGLKIDGLSENAGNIPTGNNHPGTQKNRLILTPSELAKKCKELLDNPDPNPTHPGDLTDMLTYTREFYNHNNNSNSNSNSNSNNLLVTFTGIKSHHSPNERRMNASMEMLHEDIRRYDFVPHERHTLVHSCINLKTDIYRYPSILIYDLKIIYGIEESNTWETLQALLDKRVISQELYDCLLFLLCAAQYIRLSAYLDRNSQEDGISILLKNTDADKTATGKSSWHLPQALYFRICLTMSPVKSHITTNLDKDNGLREPVIFEKYGAAIGFYETLQIHEALIQCIKKQYPCLRDLNLVCKFKLAKAYVDCLKLFDGITLLSEILDTVRDNPLTSDAQKFVADYFGNQDTAIFCITVDKGNWLASCNKTKEALEILNPIASLPVPDQHLRRYYSALATVYRKLDEISLAVKYHKLSIEDTPPTDEPRCDRVVKLLNMFSHYSKNGDISKAEKAILEALKIFEQLHGEDSNHIHIGLVCHALSRLKLQTKNFSEAEKYLDRARCNTEDPASLFEFDVTSAELMMAQDDYKSACRSFLKLLISWPAIDDKLSANFVNTVHLELQIGKCYLFSGALNAAEVRLHRAKDLHGRTYVQDGPELRVCSNITEIDYYIAQCLLGKGQVKEALVAMRQCLDYSSQIIRQPSHIPEYFSDIDSSLRSIIRLLRQKGEYSGCHLSSARSCFMALRRIHNTLRNDKLASKYLKEAEKCDT